jgi:hypothetical protein
MDQRVVVVLVGTFCLLVICAISATPASVSPVSEAGDRFRLLRSVTVDGGAGGDDQVRGISVAEDGSVYVTGYVSVAGQGRDIWLARYSQDLVYQDSITINGAANSDDEGYTMAFDEDGHLFLIGYMTEAGERHNIWLGKLDTELVLIDQITVNGPSNEDDDGYGILFDSPTGNLYLAGTVREPGEGANIWLGIYDVDLDQVDAITMDGPANDTDKARFMTFDDTRHLFVSGSMTDDLSRDYDIWIGKFKDDLTFVDDITIAGPTTEEDKGYGIVFDGSDTIFVTGTMIETNESYNIWMAKFDTDLNPIDDLTINGPEDGEDVAYMMAIDHDSRLYHAGTYTETVGGTNIWLACFDPALNLEAWITIDGPAGGYDTGIGVAMGNDGDLYVSGIVSDPVEDFNIWIGRFDVSTLFTDGFESGDTSIWAATSP